MITKKRKIQNRQDFFFSISIGVLFVFLISFLVFSNLRIAKKRQSLIKEIESLEREIQAIQEKNEALKAGISESQTDEFWEEKLREQGYQKPGEKQVVIIPSETEQSKKEEGALQNILEWIKSKLK